MTELSIHRFRIRTANPRITPNAPSFTRTARRHHSTKTHTIHE